MTDLYPSTEPHNSGMLDVGDASHVYWEVCGNPVGKPALVLHGGPGSGCTPRHRRYFAPDAYRIVLFDQRECGRSTPHASDPTTDLSTNTTEHLLRDIELLRRHLGIEQWLVFGNSWGSTLALAYAERHPERVSALVLVAVGTTRPSEIDWLYHGVGRFLPEHWSRFRAGVPEADRDGDLVDAYHRLLEHPDPAVRERAARSWCEWEDAVVSPDPGIPPNPRYADPRFRMAFARIVTHYFAHDAWLEDGVLLRGADRLHDIPGTMVHGRLDLGGPLVTAWELSQTWSDAELIVVNTAGHSTGDPGMSEAAVAATDRFAASP
ncbi:MAG: prolyl aminopeptidase [Acidimicrobiia bacterium]